MSFKRSPAAARLASALLLSSAFILAGCSSKDDGPSADVSAPAAALGLKGPSDKAFAKHFAVPKREVSDSEAQQALALLGLDAPTGETLKWDKSSGQNGRYSFSGLTAKDADSTLTIKSAELVGVHMAGDVASFDRADFSGISIYNEDDNVTIAMDSLSMARPTPDMAKAIIESLAQMKEVQDLNFEAGEGGAKFGALGMSGINVSSDDINITADTMMWGEDEETELVDFKIEDVSFSGQGRGGDAFKGQLNSFSGTGLKTNALKNLRSKGRLPLYLTSFNPLSKTYDTIKMDGLNFDSDVVSVRSKGFEGKASEKGGVTTLRQVSDPFIITLKEAPNDADAKRAFELIKSLDFDELVMQKSQTTILDANTDTVQVKDGLVTMENGFNLSYNYSASGVKAMTDSLAEMERTGSRAQMEASMDALKISGFQLRLEDNSIVDRSMNLAAQMRGGTPEGVKKELKMGLTLAPMMAGGGLEGEMIGEMASAFGDFIDGGGTLSIVMAPDTPIAASTLANYKGSDMTLEDLGFSAKVE